MLPDAFNVLQELNLLLQELVLRCPLEEIDQIPRIVVPLLFLYVEVVFVLLSDILNLFVVQFKHVLLLVPYASDQLLQLSLVVEKLFLEADNVGFVALNS